MTDEAFNQNVSIWKDLKDQLAKIEASPETAGERAALQLRITKLTKMLNKHLGF